MLRRFVLGVVIAGGLVLGGCSSGSTSAPTTTTSIPAKPIPLGTVTINGKQVAVPTEIPGVAIDPVTDSAILASVTQGQVILAKDGALPATLQLRIGEPVVFTNLTSKPIKLSFEIRPPLPSHVIAPGETWTYTSKISINLWYRTSLGYEGHLSIGAFGF
jgi:hypothetical protein